MIYYNNCIHKYSAPFYHQKIIKMDLLDHNMIQKNEQFIIIKKLFRTYYKINQRFLNVRYHCYFLSSTVRNFITYG